MPDSGRPVALKLPSLSLAEGGAESPEVQHHHLQHHQRQRHRRAGGLRKSASEADPSDGGGFGRNEMFEDIYSVAKGRAYKRHADTQGAEFSDPPLAKINHSPFRAAHLPGVPEFGDVFLEQSLGALPSGYPPAPAAPKPVARLPVLEPKRNKDDVPPSPSQALGRTFGESAWRRAALAAVPGVEVGDDEDSLPISAASPASADVFVLRKRRQADDAAAREEAGEIRKTLAASVAQRRATVIEVEGPRTDESKSPKRASLLSLSPPAPAPAALSGKEAETLARQLAEDARCGSRFALAQDEILSDHEAAAAHAAFHRFQILKSAEMFKDDLYDLMKYLGIPAVREQVRALSEEHSRYNELDEDEVHGFVSTFAKQRYSHYRSEFDARAHEASGGRKVVPTSQLRSLMFAIGFIPQNCVIEETLSYWNLDDTAELGFNSFLRFLGAYRREEGFSSREVSGLRRIFGRFKQSPAMATMLPGKARAVARGKSAMPIAGVPGRCVDAALTSALGPRVEGNAERATERMRGGLGLHGESGASGASGGKSIDGGAEEIIGFRELLIIARVARELEQEAYASAFARYGVLEGGRMPKRELQNLMRSLGYEPPQSVINEALAEVGIAGTDTMDANEMCQAIVVFNARNGLTIEETEELYSVFQACDADQSNSIDVMELGDVLRSLGYVVSHSDVRMLSDRADGNRSDSLEYPEFERVMGMHRETELKRLRATFAEMQVRDRFRFVIPTARTVEALEAVLEFIPDSVKNLVKAIPKAVDFEAFVELADRGRKLGMEIMKRNAGFKEPEIQRFKMLFDRRNKDGTGEIDVRDVQGLLIGLGIQVRTREEQRAVMGRLDEARKAARDAGIAEVSKDGAGVVRFWEFVQLVRMLRSDSDKAHDELVNRTAKELRFSAQEIEQFRKIFMKWSRLDAIAALGPGLAPGSISFGGGGGGALGASVGKGTGSDGNPLRSSVRSPVRKTVSNSLAGAEATADVAEAAAPDEDGLSFDTLHRLLRSMGMRMTLTQRGIMEEQAAQFENTRRGLISFVGFLRMMRWLLDSDFAGINDVAAGAAQRNRTAGQQGP